MIRRLPLLLLTLAIGGDALAQTGGDQAVVPRQLALSIVHFQHVGSYGFFSPDAGTPTLSTDLPASLASVVPAPPGANVLGAVTWPRMSDVFGLANGSLESVRAWFGDEFKRRGYEAVNDQTQMMRFGGFRDAQSGQLGRGGYCAERDLLSLDILPLDQRRAEYRIRVTKDHQDCRGSGPRGRAAAFVDASEYPTLFNPPNAVMNQSMFGGCGEARFGSSGTSAVLTTTMSPADLMKHYEKQMGSTGWKRADVPSTATSTWTRPSPDGGETELILTASASLQAPNCRDVQMTVIRPTPRIK